MRHFGTSAWADARFRHRSTPYRGPRNGTDRGGLRASAVPAGPHGPAPWALARLARLAAVWGHPARSGAMLGGRVRGAAGRSLGRALRLVRTPADVQLAGRSAQVEERSWSRAGLGAAAAVRGQGRPRSPRVRASPLIAGRVSARSAITAVDIRPRRPPCAGHGTPRMAQDRQHCTLVAWPCPATGLARRRVRRRLERSPLVGQRRRRSRHRLAGRRGGRRVEERHREPGPHPARRLAQRLGRRRPARPDPIRTVVRSAVDIPERDRDPTH